MKRFVLVVLFAALSLLLRPVPAAQADEFSCTGALGAVTVDSLLVPVNAACTLDGTRVTGTIKVENGGALTVRQVVILGNVQADGAAELHLLAQTSVGGSVQIKQSRVVQIDETAINGDIQLEENSGGLTVTRNQVGGNVQIKKNRGSLTIADNIIAGSLEYQENEHAPAGGNNVVQADEPYDGYLSDEVVVKLAQAGDLSAVAAAYGLEPVPLAQFGTRPIFRLRIRDGADPLAKAGALAGDGRVIYAEPNFTNQTPEGRKKSSWASGEGGEAYTGQWAADKIRLPLAHAVSRGAGVTIAVLDSGVDTAHPVLAGRLTAGFDFVEMDSDPSEAGIPGRDVIFGHGTHVAGLIALAAPDASIMPIRVLDRNGIGNIWVLAEALAYAADPDGDPATDDGAHVINLSLGTTRPTNLLAEIVATVTCGKAGSDDENDDNRPAEVHQPCTAAGGRGIVVVAAAGNNGTDLREYPAAEAVTGLLAVAASTPADTLADFSTRGDWVHVVAPGEAILSSIPGGQYGVWSGTSMAAPLVAGEAALIRSVQPTLSAAQVSAHIQATAAPIGGPVPYRIDAAAALSSSPN